MLLAFLGCIPTATDSGVANPDWVDPLITSAALRCSGADARWELEVRASAWTGGGLLWMSRDGDYVEEHPFISKEAAGDGSADRLELALSVAEDFREASPGGSTAFNCGLIGLQGLLVILDRGGERPTDCRAFGDTPTVWDTWGPALPCTAVIEVEPL